MRELVEKAGDHIAEREELLSQLKSLSTELNAANHEVKTLVLENTKLASEVECYKTAEESKQGEALDDWLDSPVKL